MSEFETILSSILKFSDLIKWFIEKLEKTPAEKMTQVISDVNAAFDKARKDDDTSDIENIINNA